MGIYFTQNSETRLISDYRNHVLSVTQRHTTTTYSVAACLSRVADAEWQRSCESIRRFSPTVGPLGEWRALCEGGWLGSIPQGLPDLDTSSPQQPQDTQQASSPTSEEIKARTPEFRESTEQPLLLPVGYSTTPLAQHSWSDPPLRVRDYNHPAGGSPTIPRQNPYSMANSEGYPDYAPTSLEPPSLPFVDPNTGSVRSLSAFPSPPAHFPLPPPPQQPQQSSISQLVHPSSLDFNLSSQPMDSPVSTSDDRPGFSVEHSDQIEHQQYARGNPGSLPLTPLSSEHMLERPRIQGRKSDLTPPTTTSPNDFRLSTATQPQMVMPTNITQDVFKNPPLHDMRHESSSSGDTRPSYTHPHKQDDYQANGREFGMDYNPRQTNSRTNDNSGPRASLEGVDTRSSLVAAMRDRFSNAVCHFCFSL